MNGMGSLAGTDGWEKIRVRGQGKRLPGAKELGETSLMFMVHPTLGVDEMRDTCRAVEKVLGR